MKSHTVRLSVPLLLACLGGTLVLPATLPLRSAANILPESALIIHVQPVSGSCETPITLCDDIVNTSRASGPQEFLIFFEPIAWQGSEDLVMLAGLHTELTWPGTWELIEFDPCWGSGELSGAGPPYALDMSWYYYPYLPMGHHEVFLIARLVLDVHGEGWLGFPPGYHSPIDLAGIITLAHGSPAQAGVECGYTRYDCGHGPLCELVLADTELQLHAPLGGVAAGETLLDEIGHCLVEVDPGAAWLRVKVVSIPWHDQSRIELSADATGLSPGTYQAWVQASSPMWSTDCLKVVFTVGDLTPALQTSWSAIKAQYR